MQRKSRLKPWMLVAAIWIWPALFAVVERFGQEKLRGWDPPTLVDMIFGAGDWLLYALVTPVIFWIAERWPIARPHIARRAVFHFACALFFCVVWATSGKALEYSLAWAFAPERLASLGKGPHATSTLARVSTDVASWVLTTLPFGMVVYITVAGMAHALRYFNESRDREMQVARLDEQLTNARFAALQAQLNPHFLFNTLNTITVLIRDNDQRGAVQIVERLSAMLRRTLARHQSREVPLAEELALVDSYLAIERARFPDRLTVSVQVDASLRRAAVPTFAVQHLVENAVRHGIATRESGGRVVIEGTRAGPDVVIVVRDDGPGMRGEPHDGGGIANTRERLRGLYGAGASLTVTTAQGGGTIATLRIPYREMDGNMPNDDRNGEDTDAIE